MWRAYIDSLSSRRLKDRAREFRKHTRWLTRCGLPEGDPRRQSVVVYLETLGPFLPDYPCDVFNFDTRLPQDEAGQRRYLRAVETFARVRKLLGQPAIQFNIATHGGQQVVQNSAPGPA